MDRIPAARAKSTTLAARTFFPTAKYTVFIDFSSAYARVQPSGQLSPELRMARPPTRLLALNSRVLGPSQYESIEMPALSAAPSVKNLNADPDGWLALEGVPSASTGSLYQQAMSKPAPL